MKRIGSIVGYQNSPCIYIIIKRDFIYIGESQRLPVSRWGEHLCKMGTFTQKLLEAHEDLAKSNNFLIYFFAYNCDELYKLFEAESLIKRNTQYIEDYLHRKFVSHQLSTKYKLISDTSRTAPIRANAKEVELLGEEIFMLMIEDIESIN